LEGLAAVQKDLIHKATQEEQPWKAILALPPTVRLVRVRSDSAAYVHELLDWCREEIPGRPRIQFAISADMTEELRAPIQALPEEVWKPLRKVTDKGLIVGRKE